MFLTYELKSATVRQAQLTTVLVLYVFICVRDRPRTFGNTCD